jgi:putative methyltransferase (TIGR04325 family)
VDNRAYKPGKLGNVGRQEPSVISSPGRWFLSKLLPPILPSIINRVRRSFRRSSEGAPILDFRPSWQYVSEGWSPTNPQANGWYHPSIAETQRARWAEFSTLLSGTGPLGISHETTTTITSNDESAHNLLMTFAYILARAAQHRTRLSVLDWGGGTGHFALVAHAVMPDLSIDYVVRDLPGLCGVGRALMPSVRFEDADETCFSRHYELVLASNSIQYAEDWQGLLGRLAAVSDAWLFIARVPIVRQAASFVVVQRPHDYGYETEYISWVLNRDSFLSHAARLGLILDREFLAGGAVHGWGAPEAWETQSFLFRSAVRRASDL